MAPLPAAAAISAAQAAAFGAITAQKGGYHAAVTFCGVAAHAPEGLVDAVMHMPCDASSRKVFGTLKRNQQLAAVAHAARAFREFEAYCI